jgi:hypothetical protein
LQRYHHFDDVTAKGMVINRGRRENEDHQATTLSRTAVAGQACAGNIAGYCETKLIKALQWPPQLPLRARVSTHSRPLFITGFRNYSRCKVRARYGDRIGGSERRNETCDDGGADWAALRSQDRARAAPRPDPPAQSGCRRLWPVPVLSPSRRDQRRRYCLEAPGPVPFSAPAPRTRLSSRTKPTRAQCRAS